MATKALTEEQHNANESRLDEKVLLSLGYDSNPGHGSTIAQGDALQDSVLLRPSMCTLQVQGREERGKWRERPGGEREGREGEGWMLLCGTSLNGSAQARCGSGCEAKSCFFEVRWLHDILKIVHAILVVITAIASAVRCRRCRRSRRSRASVRMSVLLRRHWLGTLVAGIAGD